MTLCSKTSCVAFEKELEQAIGLDRRAQAPQDFLVRRLVGHIVLEKNENAFAQSFLVHLAVELGAVDGFAVETNELIRTHVGLCEIDPTGTELTDPVVVTELNMESLGKLCQKRIGDAGWCELDREGADLRSFLVLDDGTAAEISQELVAPAGAENGAAVVDRGVG